MRFAFATFGVALAAWFTVAGDAPADCFQRARVVTHQVYSSYAPYYAPLYHYVPVAVFDAIKPVYAVGGGYRGEGAETAELARALEKLTLAVDRLASKGTEPQAAADLGPRALAVVNARCAKCHEQGVAALGGDFVLTKGGQWYEGLTAADLIQSAKKVADGTMPKGGAPLPPEEKQVLSAYADQKYAAERQVRKGR
jgi:mono/diheme cytochrome c family protein